MGLEQKPKQRIYIIEDDRDTAICVEEALLDEGYAVEVINYFKIDDQLPAILQGVVLLDLSVNGEEVSKQLRAQAKNGDLKIVVMSANEKVVEIAQTMNVDGILPKPFDLVDLYTTVGNLSTKLNSTKP